ncbi:hypothetical protein BEH_07950 [Priestia filamentosa]|uniref:Uncharacterized protein n=1 Tax=Priestia filamentosa TaxID=1402861 RepID=A0A0H4KD34_9BACI|nr:hypothetical protein [Priestia filamentosa]AKO92037.1 hypothetical protein BEH_07950 [Priestia filamentosa]
MSEAFEYEVHNEKPKLSEEESRSIWEAYASEYMMGSGEMDDLMLNTSEEAAYAEYDANNTTDRIIKD